MTEVQSTSPAGGPSESGAPDPGLATFGVMPTGDTGSDSAPAIGSRVANPDKVGGGPVGEQPIAGTAGQAANGGKQTPQSAAPASPDSTTPQAPAVEGEAPANTPAPAGETFFEITRQDGSKKGYTADQAKHALRTLLGVYKSREAREAQVVADARARIESWQNENARLRAENEQLKQQGGAKPPSPSPASGNGKQGTESDQGIDWGMVDDILGHPQGGPGVALQYVYQEMQKLAEARETKLRETLKGELSTEYQPLLDAKAQVEVERELGSLVTSVASYVMPAGHPRAGQLAYPELHNETSLRGVAAALGDLAPYLSEDQLKSPMAIHLAVLAYRHAAGTGSEPVVGSSTTAPGGNSPVVPGNAAIASALNGNEPPAARPTPPGTNSLLQAMRAAGNRDPVFGVAALN